MKFIKQYWLVLSIFLLITCMIMIRAFSTSNFRYDALKWAEPSALGINILTEDMIPLLNGKMLFVNLDNKAADDDERFKNNTLMLEPLAVLDKENLSRIRKNDGPVILFSEDTSLSARIWMVLSEMGMKDLYILPYDNADEVK